MSERGARKRGSGVARLLLASVALAGVGAAVTAAVWTDEVHLAATAESSTFDIQARFSVFQQWQDVGLPGDPDTFDDGFEIAIPPIDDVLPAHSYVGDVFLCNAGAVDGVIFDASLSEVTTSRQGPVLPALRLVEDGSIEVENINIGTIIPANSCSDPVIDPDFDPRIDPMPDVDNDVEGILHFTTVPDFTGLYGSTSRIVIKIWVSSVP